MIEDASGRAFERVLANILPHRAVSARTHQYDPATSDPFVPDEVVAVRDTPGTPFYLAKVVSIAADSISVQYFGCTQRDIARAVFRPAWHLPGSQAISLSATQPQNTIPYTGVLEFDSLRQLLVARNLEFTASNRLRRASQRTIAPLHDELFVFDR